MKLRQIIAIPRQNLARGAHPVFGDWVFGHNHAKTAIRGSKGSRSVAFVNPQHPYRRVKIGQVVAPLRTATGKRARAHAAIWAKTQIILRAGSAPLRRNLQGGSSGARRSSPKTCHLPPCAQHARNGQGGGGIDRGRARAKPLRRRLRRSALRAADQGQKRQPCP